MSYLGSSRAFDKRQTTVTMTARKKRGKCKQWLTFEIQVQSIYDQVVRPHHSPSYCCQHSSTQVVSNPLDRFLICSIAQEILEIILVDKCLRSNI